MRIIRLIINVNGSNKQHNWPCGLTSAIRIIWKISNHHQRNWISMENLNIDNDLQMTLEIFMTQISIVSIIAAHQNEQCIVDKCWLGIHCRQLTITWDENRFSHSTKNKNSPFSYLKCIIADSAFIRWKWQFFYLFSLFMQFLSHTLVLCSQYL